MWWIPAAIGVGSALIKGVAGSSQGQAQAQGNLKQDLYSMRPVQLQQQRRQWTPEALLQQSRGRVAGI